MSVFMNHDDEADVEMMIMTMMMMLMLILTMPMIGGVNDKDDGNVHLGTEGVLGLELKELLTL